jgi:cob(I)alamin adenosyltransferase
MSIWIEKVYTKGGDRGETSLVGGRRVQKDAPRIESYGTVDELNACIGLVRHYNRGEPGPAGVVARVDAILARVQSELFNLGSTLATLPEDLAPTQPRVEARHTEALEREIDELNGGLPPLRSFTLPGGGATSSYLHLARTVCRRAERAVVQLCHAEGDQAVPIEAVRYLNRLSDALYVLGRWNGAQRGEAEVLWQPERT